jgi:vacuolar-type H+-ATPase subunit I/STV1
LVKLLKEKNLYDDLNLVGRSDHGLSQMASRNTLLIQDYTNRNYINATRTVYGATTHLFPLNGYVSYTNIPKFKSIIDRFLCAVGYCL